LTNLLIKLFVKDYQNISNFRVRERYGKFASITGIISNLLLFLIKIVTGLIFNSISIIADAINNLSDSGSSIITLIGFKISGKPADKNHPYGHKRMEYVSGLIVSIVILVLGVQLTISSLGKIIKPEGTKFSMVSIAILVISILIKLWQSLFYRKIGKKINSTTLIATSMDSRNDILSTSAVLVGVVITQLTGFNLDGYIGTAVALFIVASGVGLIKETISPLLGIAPKKELVDKIYEKILSYEGIIGLHDLTVHSYGEGQCYASVHCEVSAEKDIMVSHDIIDNIERDFLEELGINLVVHLDPVVINDSRTNKLRAEVEYIIENISPQLSIHDFRVVWGVTHSNLIFDVVAPYEFQWSDEELVKIISDKICELSPSYRPVITVDHHYIPDEQSIRENIRGRFR